jgi:very-short-patch-repair endonuclease
MRAIRLDPNFDINSINFLEEYFKNKFSIDITHVDISIMEEIFIDIVTKKFEINKVNTVFQIYLKYSMPMGRINSKFISTLIKKRRGEKNSNNTEFFKDYFVDDWLIAKNKKVQPNNYSIQTWVDKGMTVEDAEEYIKEIKFKTSGSIQSYIFRYGEELGSQKYKNFCELSGYRNTLSGKQDLYGDIIGAEKYIQEQSTRSMVQSMGYHKQNGTLDKYNSANSNRSLKNSFNYMAETYGFEAARDICKSRGRPYEQLVEIHGETKANKIIFDRTIWFVYENAVSKFGVDAANNFISKKIQSNREKFNCNFSPRISKESIKCLNFIYSFLRDNGFSDSDIIWGKDGAQEKVIYFSNTSYKKKRYYDFCIEKLKIIIEYNGSAYHVNTNGMSIEEYNGWKSPWGIGATESLSRDLEKKELAESHGYTVLYMWDNSVDKDLKNIFEILRNKIEDYKNIIG